ncbi:hypothetical protein GCM10008986_14550 [Salinibacillus aidingensis]|uniref:DUF2642 domain-containing protein n=1 Tax=Salinibacillus aidingensis TaxID=237684 RepID=A0ABN1B3X1_9BACI
MLNQVMLRNLVVANNSTRETENNLIDLPDFNFNFDLDGDGDDETDNGNGTSTTLRDVLSDLTNEQVEVTTSFGPVTGTLIAVQSNYVVILETTGDTVLVPFEQIQFVSEL